MTDKLSKMELKQNLRRLKLRLENAKGRKEIADDSPFRAITRGHINEEVAGLEKTTERLRKKIEAFQ